LGKDDAIVHSALVEIQKIFGGECIMLLAKKYSLAMEQLSLFKKKGIKVLNKNYVLAQYPIST